MIKAQATAARVHTRLGVFATVVVASIALAGCAPASEPVESDGPAAEGWDAIVEAAKGEGGVLFSTVGDEVTGQNVVDAFTADTGIPAESFRLSSADVATRFSAEAESGAIAVDVVLDANLNFIPVAIENGWILEPTTDLLPELENYPADWNHNGAVSFAITPWGTCYNTEAVAEAPTWEDMATSAFADQVIVADPSVSLAYVSQWAMLRDELGDDFISSIGENISLVAAGGPPAMEALAAGEGSVNFLCTENLSLSSQAVGAPVDFTVPSPTTGIYQVLGVAADAPNPNAARVFANWLLSEAGTAAFNQTQPQNLTVYEDSPVEIKTAPDGFEDQTDEILKLLGIG